MSREHHCRQHPIRLRALSLAGDELLDMVGDDVLGLDIEYRVIGARNLHEPRVRNVLGKVAPASDQNQRVGDAMEDQSGRTDHR